MTLFITMLVLSAIYLSYEYWTAPEGDDNA